jgi:hypothetical protein
MTSTFNLSEAIRDHQKAFPNFSSDPSGYIPDVSRVTEKLSSSEITSMVVKVKTYNTTLTENDSNAVIHCDLSDSSWYGTAGGTVTITLPPAQTGLSYEFDFTQLDTSNTRVMPQNTFIKIKTARATEYFKGVVPIAGPSGKFMVQDTPSTVVSGATKYYTQLQIGNEDFTQGMSANNLGTTKLKLACVGNKAITVLSGTSQYASSIGAWTFEGYSVQSTSGHDLFKVKAV